MTLLAYIVDRNKKPLSESLNELSKRVAEARENQDDLTKLSLDMFSTIETLSTRLEEAHEEISHSAEVLAETRGVLAQVQAQNAELYAMNMALAKAVTSSSSRSVFPKLDFEKVSKKVVGDN